MPSLILSLDFAGMVMTVKMFRASTKRIISTAICGCVFLAACSPAEDPEPSPHLDPIEMQALNDPVMVDPDLVFQDEGAAALTMNLDHSLPPINSSPGAIAAAREEATVLAGGNAAILDLPEPTEAKPENDDAIAPLLTRAAQLPNARECAQNGTYGAIWGARFAAALPIYPRASLTDGAGNEAGQCAVRAATFLTPVPLEEVLAFYFTMANLAGFETRYSVSGAEHALSGISAQQSFAVYARPLPTGGVRVHLITNGFAKS